MSDVSLQGAENVSPVREQFQQPTSSAADPREPAVGSRDSAGYPREHNVTPGVRSSSGTQHERQRTAALAACVRALGCFGGARNSQWTQAQAKRETTTGATDQSAEPSVPCESKVGSAVATENTEDVLGAVDGDHGAPADVDAERSSEVSSASEELPFRSLYRRAQVKWARRRLEKQVQKLLAFTSTQLSNLQHVRSGQKLDAEFAILARIYTNAHIDEDFARFSRQEFRTFAEHLPLFLNYLLHSRPLDAPATSAAQRNAWREVASSTRERIRRHQNTRKLIETHLLRRCSESVRFALFVYWYLDGCLQLGPESDRKDTLRIIIEIENIMSRSITCATPSSQVAEARPPVKSFMASDTPDAATADSAPATWSPGAALAAPAGEVLSPADAADVGSVERIVHQRAIVHEIGNESRGEGVFRDRMLQDETCLAGILPAEHTIAVDLDADAADRAVRSADCSFPEAPGVQSTTEQEPRMLAQSSLMSNTRVFPRESIETGPEREISFAYVSRGNLFHAQLDFMRALISISELALGLNRSQRSRFVVRELGRLNALVEAERRYVFLPTERIPHRVLRILADEAHVFSTKEHAPYLAIVEVQDLESTKLAEREPRKTLARTIGDWLHRAGEYRPRAPRSEQRHTMTWFASPRGTEAVKSPESGLAAATSPATTPDPPTSPASRSAPAVDTPSPAGEELSQSRGGKNASVSEKRSARTRLHAQERHARNRALHGVANAAAHSLTFPGPNQAEAPFPFSTRTGTDAAELPPMTHRSQRQQQQQQQQRLRADGVGSSHPNLETAAASATGDGMTASMPACSEAQDARDLGAELESGEIKNALAESREACSTPTSVGSDRWRRLFGERWAERVQRLQQTSPFGRMPGWRLTSVIVKSKDQLRQEMFATMLIAEFARIFESARLDVWLCPYRIVATGADCGFVQVIPDAPSIDQIKKAFHGNMTLSGYFEERFGARGSATHRLAVRNFVKSMAAYSVITYLLNIKDRHNGNLLIDAEGHIIHIDFGFFFTNSPGGNIEFEKAPFKLTWELADVMGGPDSNAFRLFRRLCGQAYAEACAHRNKIMLMVEFMMMGNESLPCFRGGADLTLEQLRERFMPRQTRVKRIAHMNALIDRSSNHWTTRFYDRYQRCCTGIY